MSAISPINPVSSEEIGPNQQAFIDRAQKTVLNVAIELLLLQNSVAFQDAGQDMDWSLFKVTHIDPKQQALAEIDDRTRKFFMKMMDAITPGINAVPAIINFLQNIEMKVQKPQISKKLVEGIALHHVETMMSELDAINTSIVNDVINS